MASVKSGKAKIEELRSKKTFSLIDSYLFVHYFCHPAINVAYLTLRVHTISNFTDVLLSTQKNMVLSLKDGMARWPGKQRQRRKQLYNHYDKGRPRVLLGLRIPKWVCQGR